MVTAQRFRPEYEEDRRDEDAEQEWVEEQEELDYWSAENLVDGE